MHEAVFVLTMLWLVALCAGLAVYAGRTRDLGRQAIALDALSYVLVFALAILAIERREAGFLDVALVIGALGFVQTVALARLVTGRGGAA